MVRKKEKKSPPQSHKAQALLFQLKKSWPKPVSQEALLILNQLENTLNVCIGKKGSTLEFLDFPFVLQKILSELDPLFLRKQITYQLAIEKEMPKIFGSSNDILLVLNSLVSCIAKFATRKTKIEIHLEPFDLRFGEGLGMRIVGYGDSSLSDEERQHLFGKFYLGKSLIGKKREGELKINPELDEIGGSLAYCRELIHTAFGQLWFEVSNEGKMTIMVVLPSFDYTQMAKNEKLNSFKLDVVLNNFSKLRQRFGIEKAAALVKQVEQLIKGLVRFPVDFVTSFPEQGRIVVLFDAHGKAEDAVATRISKRLQGESFRVSHKPFLPNFHYEVSKLI